MIIKLSYEKSNEIGVFMKLTNSFCIVPYDISDKCYKTLKENLNSFVPIVRTYICNSRCIGRLIIGNKNGLLLPYETSNVELNTIKNSIPDNILVKRCNENLSALGNCIVNNDNSAIVYPDVSNQTEELISDTLGVEVFKLSLGEEKLVGSYCIFNNNGGIIHPSITIEEQDEISSLLQIPLFIGTVNCGENRVSSGIISNDNISLCGMKTTQSELFVIETALKKKKTSEKNY
ncbi:translation initiation factor eIF6 (nucleomorph) [Chroomonas mesostigmatica CCMP1168]|uniref:Eukaryotic translation initiation factor 6 n=1 Tax=Chroomonas mesostigmatica CCMP1168 TaxID=1195612 RepID=J7G5B1_9CRYP|nr:translation initiation factor eIF6 [Chroomonas mesostigmatica CCMP1168]